MLGTHYKLKALMSSRSCGICIALTLNTWKNWRGLVRALSNLPPRCPRLVKLVLSTVEGAPPSDLLFCILEHSNRSSLTARSPFVRLFLYTAVTETSNSRRGPQRVRYGESGRAQTGRTSLLSRQPKPRLWRGSRLGRARRPLSQRGHDGALKSGPPRRTTRVVPRV